MTPAMGLWIYEIPPPHPPPRTLIMSPCRANPPEFVLLHDFSNISFIISRIHRFLLLTRFPTPPSSWFPNSPSTWSLGAKKIKKISWIFCNGSLSSRKYCGEWGNKKEDLLPLPPQITPSTLLSRHSTLGEGAIL